MIAGTPGQAPEVSVVMSVYNGAARLPATLCSILEQEGCDFEFIVVDDGSTDDSGRILAEWTGRDDRIRMIRLAENGGLTNALRRGCSEARGEFIARQDCGDASLPGRLARQAAALHADPDCVMVASATRYVGPGGEFLYDVVRDGAQLNDGLLGRSLNELSGPPHHGATMFRRTAYEATGGYRQPFVVAQDVDLWLRLVERGRCIGIADVGYVAGLEPGSISSRRRSEQFELAELALECAKRRRAGASDEPLLAGRGDAPARRRGKGAPSRGELARFHYFIGCCLRVSDPLAANKYFRMAVREQPLLMKAWWRLATS